MLAHDTISASREHFGYEISNSIYKWTRMLLGTFIFMSVWCLSSASVRDPGYCKFENPPSDFVKPAICGICAVWKPPRAHHCRRCNRCVFRMDHHCLWIDNCVGYRNQKSFILFLLYAAILSVLTFMCLLYSFVYNYDQVDLPVHVSMMLVALISIKYTYEFLDEQMDFVETNATLVETYQNSKGSVPVNVFRHMFGDNMFLWLFPIYTSKSVDFSESVVTTGFLSKSDADELGINIDDISDKKVD